MKKKLCKKIPKGLNSIVVPTPSGAVPIPVYVSTPTSFDERNPLDNLWSSYQTSDFRNNFMLPIRRWITGQNVDHYAQNENGSYIQLTPEQASQSVVITPEQLELMREYVEGTPVSWDPALLAYDWRGTLGGKVAGSLGRGIGWVRRKLTGENTESNDSTPIFIPIPDGEPIPENSDDNSENTNELNNNLSSNSNKNPNKNSNKNSNKWKKRAKKAAWTTAGVAAVTSKPIKNYVWPTIQNVYNWGWSNDPTYRNIPSHVSSEEDLWYNSGTGWINGVYYKNGVPVKSVYLNNTQQLDTTNTNYTPTQQGVLSYDEAIEELNRRKQK